MSKVEFFELRSTKALKLIERRINAELKKAFAPASPTVKLFQSNKEIVYSIGALPVSGSKKVLDAVEKIVRKGVGDRRGRPVGEPTHQVKARLRETKYRALVKAAKKKGVSPSRLALNILETHI